MYMHVTNTIRVMNKHTHDITILNLSLSIHVRNIDMQIGSNSKYFIPHLSINPTYYKTN
jgi:hypothetical protein